MVGKFIHLTNITPDILFIVGIVSRYMLKPQVPHLNAVKHTFKYLRGTTSYGICYWVGENNTLQGFADADWASDQESS
jgi:hypothetical protein